MAEKGNPNSVSDAGVGALCVYTAVYGAFLNVKINCADFKDADFVNQMMSQGKSILETTIKERDDILSIVNRIIEKE
jgi:glutamate formiminotransferase/formiminotetrahydrofolate cyclodeaminase